METAPFFLSFPTLPQLVRLLGAFLFFICPVIADLSEFPSLPSSVLTVIRLPKPMGLNFVHWSHWGRFKKTKNTYCCLGLSSSLHIYTHTPRWFSSTVKAENSCPRLFTLVLLGFTEFSTTVHFLILPLPSLGSVCPVILNLSQFIASPFSESWKGI